MSGEINDTVRAFTPIVAILCVSVVAVEAFHMGLDGAIWTATTATIALLAGIKAPDLVKKLRE